MIILWQHYKHSNQTDNSVSISNSVPLESPTHEHSISGTVSEKKVKPPAIPPKTYREPKVELNITLCSSDDDASAQGGANTGRIPASGHAHAHAPAWRL